MIDKRQLEAILKKVEKPARYIGGELNSYIKDFEKTPVSFLFSFPDVYEVGMSHIGMQIIYNLINEEEDFLCERCFAPWPDMEGQMREHQIPLHSLENKVEAKRFDFWGFTLQYEMSYTNILNMLDLAGVPFYSKDRDESYPIIVAGGPSAYNPEPIADFIDIFILGEGEEVNLELMNLYKDHKPSFNKEKFLKEACKIEGLYIPKFYDIEYNDDGTIKKFEKKYEAAPDKIKKRYIRELSKIYKHEKMLVSFVELVHHRVSFEIFRGCTHGCRFCQAGMVYRPVREKPMEDVVKQAIALAKSTGYEDVSLSSLSSCDYSDLLPLLRNLIGEFEENKIGVSLPSLRLDTFSVNALKEIEKVRKSSLTFAPEAGSQRLRNVINKGIDEEDIENTISLVFKEGWSKIKLYFMIGLPTERKEDTLGIVSIANKVKSMFFDMPKEERRGDLRVTVSVSSFVPKAFTPFQWFPQNSLEEFYEKIDFLKANIRDPKVKLNYHDPKVSRMEAVVSRGDRRVSKLILRAWERGQKFDGWSEYFDYENWLGSANDIGLDIDFYASRERSFDEVLPWDFIDIGVSKDYLIKEYKKALTEDTTRDCRLSCNACGIKDCVMWGRYENTSNL